LIEFFGCGEKTEGNINECRLDTIAKSASIEEKVPKDANRPI